MCAHAEPGRRAGLARAHARASRSEGLAGAGTLSSADVISFPAEFPGPLTFTGELPAGLPLVASGDSPATQYALTSGLPGTEAFLADRPGRLEGPRPAGERLMLTRADVEIAIDVARTDPEANRNPGTGPLHGSEKDGTGDRHRRA